jgi:hypothetical protein
VDNYIEKAARVSKGVGIIVSSFKETVGISCSGPELAMLDKGPESHPEPVP